MLSFTRFLKEGDFTEGALITAFVYVVLYTEASMVTSPSPSFYTFFTIAFLICYNNVPSFSRNE